MNQAVATEDNAHAPFAPSGFKRKKLCAGSHNAEKHYPNVSNDAAIDGTHTHFLVETCLIHNKPDAKEYVGMKLCDHEGEFEVKADRAERANMALDYVANQVKASAYPVIVTPEQKLDPGSLIFRDDWYGTGDITMLFVEGYEPGGAIVPQNIKWINVVDYKDGGQPVDPFENYQGISYMLGVIAQYTPPMDTPIIFTIIQPKSGGVKEWHSTVGELMSTWLPDCQQIIELSLDPNAPRTPGDEQCTHCLNRKNCVERQGAAISGINEAMGELQLQPAVQTAPAIDFTGEPQPLAPIQTVSTALPLIGDMDNDTISSVMHLAPIIRGWLKDLNEEALERVKQGGKMPGYKMVQKRGRRSWQAGTADIVKSLLSMTADRKRIFKKDDIVEDKLISFAKILANPNLKSKQKQRIEKEFIKQPQGQKALVLETEKGEDISPAALLENADMPVVTMQTDTTLNVNN